MIDTFYPEWLLLDSNKDKILIEKGEFSKSMEVSKTDTCTVNNDNYRISSKRVVNKSLPVQSALNLKIDEFCHKHKKCLICDLNVNSLDLQILWIFREKLNCQVYRIIKVVEYQFFQS